MTTMTAAQLRAQTGGMQPDPEVPERRRVQKLSHVC